MYKICGRFTDSDNTTNGYYLEGNSGERIKASIKYTTELASKGLIGNAKTQSTRDGRILLRGKLINLTKLPIIVGSIDGIKIIGDAMITGVIYKGYAIAGYVIENTNGKKSRLSYKKVIELVSNSSIGNATIVRNNEDEIIIKCDESSISKYYMDINNKIYKEGSSGVMVRAVQQSSGGIINYEPFNRNDWLICSYNGKVSIVSNKDFNTLYEQCDSKVAICDLYLNSECIKICRFDTTEDEINSSDIKDWLIYRQVIDSKKNNIFIERKMMGDG